MGRMTAPCMQLVLTGFLAPTQLGPLLSPQQKIWRETRALSALITGVDPEVQDRQDFCVQHLEDTMGLLSGHFYVRDTFPSTKKQQAQDIIESVIQGFIRRLPDMAWLDEATRKHAEKKVRCSHGDSHRGSGLTDGWV